MALLDSDDTWSSWKLELQLACMERCSDIGMVWSEMEAIGPNGYVISPTYLRMMYSAYQWFPRKEQLFQQSFPLRQIAPALASVVRDRAVVHGRDLLPDDHGQSGAHFDRAHARESGWKRSVVLMRNSVMLARIMIFTCGHVARGLSVSLTWQPSATRREPPTSLRAMRTS